MRRKELVKKLTPKLRLTSFFESTGCAILTNEVNFELVVSGIPDKDIGKYVVSAFYSDRANNLKHTDISRITNVPLQGDTNPRYVAKFKQPDPDTIADGDTVTFVLVDEKEEQLLLDYNVLYLLLKMPFTVNMDYPRNFTVGDSYTFEPSLTPWAESVAYRLDLVLKDEESELIFESGIVDVMDGTLNIKALSNGRARLKLTTLINNKIKLEKIFTVEVSDQVYNDNKEDEKYEY